MTARQGPGDPTLCCFGGGLRSTELSRLLEGLEDRDRDGEEREQKLLIGGGRG